MKQILFAIACLICSCFNYASQESQTLTYHLICPPKAEKAQLLGNNIKPLIYFGDPEKILTPVAKEIDLKVVTHTISLSASLDSAKNKYLEYIRIILEKYPDTVYNGCVVLEKQENRKSIRDYTHEQSIGLNERGAWTFELFEGPIGITPKGGDCVWFPHWYRETINALNINRSRSEIFFVLEPKSEMKRQIPIFRYLCLGGCGIVILYLLANIFKNGNCFAY